jgi:5-methylcytosine-specific restriction endonuclease McrA
VPFAESTIDHIVPVSKGGKDTLDNMAVACYACNQAKGNWTLGELERRLARMIDNIGQMRKSCGFDEGGR